jgi:alpha-2-macroglobulin
MNRFARFAPRWSLFIGLFVLTFSLMIQHIVNGQDDKEEGFQFRLSELRKNAPPSPTPTIAAPPSSILLDGATRNLLKRLPAIVVAEGDQKEFALRERSLPPPRAGRVSDEPFPPAPSSAAPVDSTAGSLEVMRIAPEGAVELAPHLSVTFSQPMVAMASNEDLAASQPPVKLSPQPAGKWRWVGTKTLLFEPDGRFPMATEYTAEIPAGTKSVLGGTLGATKRWRFATPPLRLKSKFPTGESKPRDQLLFVEFDQKVDQERLLKHIGLRAGGREWPLRLATAQEIADDEEINELAAKAEPGRWLAFRAEELLPADSGVTVTIAPGAPSADGPRVTTDEQWFPFTTYGPLRVVEYGCGDGTRRDKCSPGANWTARFSNELAYDFDPAKVRVEPEMAGLKVGSNYRGLIIEGIARPRTAYRVILDASITDVYGQALGQPVTLNFTTGPIQPWLFTLSGVVGLGGDLITLDPAGQKRIPIYSVNYESFRVALYAVTPEDYGKFAGAVRERLTYRRNSYPPRPFPEIGRRVFAETIKPDARPDEMAVTTIDLRPALRDGLGHALLIVEPTAPVMTPFGPQFITTWIQATEIGLDAFADRTQLLGWATSLKEGKPIAGARLELLEEAPGGKAIAGATAQTGADGLAQITLPSEGGRKVLVARHGDDAALLLENPGWWDDGGGWMKRPPIDTLRWHVFDDRAIYRPGEEVHIKGWLRRVGGGPRGDVTSAQDVVKRLNYTLKDSRDNEIAKGALQINAFGGFDAKFKLPLTVNLGFARLKLRAEGAPSEIEGREYSHRLQIQEFRRPEYEVKASASAGPHFVGGHAELTATANYYAGGPLPNAEMNWLVGSFPTNYTPPNRDDFTFGKWLPWWYYENEPPDTPGETFEGVTDAAGIHRLRIDFGSINPPRTRLITADVRTTDVNRQSVSADLRFLVHPAELYVGVRSPRVFTQQGEPLVVEAIVTDLDGKAVANREIKMRAVRLDWVFKKGEWVERESDLQQCAIRSAADPATCRFETREGGRYQVVASITDDRERRNETELTLWVAGGKGPSERNLTKEKIELIPDRKEYKAGDTAEILIQAPFAPAEGVVTLRRSGLLSRERFTINTNSHTLRIPIKDEYAPNVHVQVDLVGATWRADEEGNQQRQLPKRPALASGELKLSIPPLRRELAVTATPRDKTLEPGGVTAVDIVVRDAADNPLRGSEVALVVVDEAVLALTKYELADPLASFYRTREPETRDHHLRENVLLVENQELMGMLRSPSEKLSLLSQLQQEQPYRLATQIDYDATQTVIVSASAPEAEIRTRKNFNPLATFAPAALTDAAGRATVKIKLPDNLTRYRVMAVAVAGEKQFGKGESAITARLPLMARPSTPRFLNFGDRFELPVVVQNQTDTPMQVDVVARASNAEFVVPPTRGSGLVNRHIPPKGATTNASNAGRRVTVPANDRVEVRFPTTTVSPGVARFQIAVTAGKWSDAAEISIPVWTPATTEAFATYGEIDDGAIVQPVQAPARAFKQFGGLEVTTSSTQLQSLTDAVLYLSSYPYECSEQISSRILAIAALRDALGAFDAKGLPPPNELIATANRDLKRLEALQDGNGGFGFWRRDDDNEWPYLSVHAAHAMVRAKEKGFQVRPEVTELSKRYLREIERHIPSWYSEDARQSLIAYALYVRGLMGDRGAAEARMLIERAGGVEKLPLESLGWLLAVLSGDANSTKEVAAIRRQLNNRVEETAGAAHFTTSYKDGAHLLLHSDRRADAIILEALIGDDPKSDLIPKLIRGLLAHRKSGRWANTQENVFALLALGRYFEAYEKAPPNFVARMWLGDVFAGGQQFRGRSTDSRQINIPMNYLMAQPARQNLTLSKEGRGRLYYRIGMNYSPENLQLKPADQGFTVTRVYEAIDDPNDVRRHEDGTWRIKAGAKVRVRLTMVAPSRRYHVALVDPLPAGFETLNPELAITGHIPQDPNDRKNMWRWAWRWFEHQNMRDERVEAFTSLLWEGVYNYSYVARATTPGVFVVPPSKAEEMYHPETFGRGATDRVVVE